MWDAAFFLVPMQFVPTLVRSHFLDQLHQLQLYQLFLRPAMVGRAEKARKYCRWAFYIPSGPRQLTWRRVLREVAEASRVGLQVVEVSACRLDVIYPHGVTWNSAWRLTQLAGQKDHTFRILGDPQGILDEPGAAASAESPQTTDQQAKRHRFSSKRSEGAGAASAPRSVNPRWASLPGASLRAPSTLPPSFSNTAGPADSLTAASSSGPAVVELRNWLPPVLLSLKWEEVMSDLKKAASAVQPAATYEVDWANPLGEGSFGVVYPGCIRGTEKRVAVKVMSWEMRQEAFAELCRSVAVVGHPDIVKVLDVEGFRPKPNKELEDLGLNQPSVALVYDRFETSVMDFLKERRLEVAAVRHILRKVVSALMHMHNLGILHADLKPANIFMRPEIFAVEEWNFWLEDSSTRKTAAVFNGCISPGGCIFKTVLGDLGCAELADPAQRRLHKVKSGVVLICTPEYRPPDMHLGNWKFSWDLDMWSLGCVAVELLLRRPLFWPAEPACTKNYLEQHLSRLGTPCKLASGFLQQLEGLSCDLEVVRPKIQVPPCQALLEFLSRFRHMADFVTTLLRWHPGTRMKAASAIVHPFLCAPSLSVWVRGGPGKHGPGSICSGMLDEEVLDYLQNCPSWSPLRDRCMADDFEPNSSISEEEGRRRMKHEFVGYVTAGNRSPVCKRLNSDANLRPIGSERVDHFARALRKCATEWLHQLQERMRSEIRRVGLPVDVLPNASPFMRENLSDNAFVYASVQVCKVGEREDGWHTDGGASLLHAGLTIFGTRQLQVRLGSCAQGCISLEQRPGSFYVGNMCTLEHNVSHAAVSAGSMGEGDQQVQIMVMLRSDLFRDARARRINACPGPSELFRIVNLETSKHLSEVPFPLPSITQVMAECPHVIEDC